MHERDYRTIMSDFIEKIQTTAALTVEDFSNALFLEP